MDKIEYDKRCSSVKAFACRYCIMTKGLKGSEISSLPQNDEEMMQHIEREHHIPVRRDSETVEQCKERFYRENPDTRNPETCKCPACQRDREMKQKGIIYMTPYLLDNTHTIVLDSRKEVMYNAKRGGSHDEGN